MTNWRCSIVLCGLLAPFLATVGLGQPAAPAVLPAAASAHTAGPAPTVQQVADAITGSWRRGSTGADGQATTSWMFISPLRVEGLANAFYFERADQPLGDDPASQRVLSIWENAQGPHVRLWEFRDPARADVLQGQWAAPNLFPSVPVSALYPVVDLVVDASEDGVLRLLTAARFPSDLPGWTQGEITATFERGSLVWHEVGRDAQGHVASDSGAQPWASAQPGAIVRSLDQGVSTIDYHVEPGTPAGYGHVLFLSYRMHTETGIFTDSSDNHGGMLRESLPIPEMKFIGWRLGIPGMTEGSRRLIIMPPGTGATGDPLILFARVTVVHAITDVPDQP